MCKVEKILNFNHVSYHKEGTNVLHREDGPALEFNDGTKIWFFNGKKHRIDGPAYETLKGFKEWWTHGEIHREDGPARIGSDVGFEWWLKGRFFPTKESWFEALTKKQKEKALYSEDFIRG
jgi:hypothetical protein